MNAFRRDNRGRQRVRGHPNVPAPWGRNCSFHEAVSTVIYCAQFFGVMPLSDIRNANPKDIKFRWFTWRHLITYGLLIWSLIVSLLSVRHLILIGITAKNTVITVFFSVSHVTFMLFLLLARNWPEIMVRWLQKESRFLQPPYTTGQDTLKRDFRVASIIIGFLAVLEHAMYQASTIYTFYTRITKCNIQSDNYFELFYTEHFPSIFTALSYHTGLAVMVQILSVTSTFIWNFMDLFIILVSIDVTKRFRQFNERLRRDMTQNDIRPQAFFREIRLDFITLHEILGYADKKLSSIILLSCLNNLYFVCYQLMHIFQKLRYPVNYAYFWMSLLYLMGRTAYLFLQASAIHEESKVPARILNRAPCDVWCTEIERFLYQLRTESIGLSSMGLFQFTRKLFFGMIGTIITFELMIIQFDVTSSDHKLPPLCD